MAALRRAAPLLLALSLTSACSDGAPTDADYDATQLVADLCRAASFAAAGDVDEARGRFTDVHAAVHELTDELTKRDEVDDRKHAAEILRAKQKVEAALGGRSGDDIATHLRALAAGAAKTTGGDATGCADRQD